MAAVKQEGSKAPLCHRCIASDEFLDSTSGAVLILLNLIFWIRAICTSHFPHFLSDRIGTADFSSAWPQICTVRELVGLPFPCKFLAKFSNQ